MAMKNIFFALVLGTGAGVIDIIPMIIQKLDKYSTISAFVQWLVLGFVITFIKIPGVDGWLNGLITAVLLSLPIIIIVMKNDPKSILIILFMSALLGDGLVKQSSKRKLQGFEGVPKVSVKKLTWIVNSGNRPANHPWFSCRVGATESEA
jgi:hypothetical protein